MWAASEIGRTKKTTEVSGARKSGFRSDIQGLRALAVLAVILDHLVGWPNGGFVGVDVFFVISGFLITGLLLREYETTGSISFSKFYRSRIRRIAPAATLVLVVTTASAWTVFNLSRFTSTAWDAVWAFFFAANWRFANVGTDYFQASGPVSPLQHYWSLAVEEQFYFVWPWLMLLVFVLVRRNRLEVKSVGRTVVGVTMVAIVASSFLWALWESANNPTWAYFSTFSRTWELGIGATIAVFAGAAKKIPTSVRSVLGWAGLIGILTSLFVVSDSVAFPAPWAALPVIATAMVIVANTGGQQKYLWPLTNRVSGYIGNISYSLYLWHFPVIILGTAIVGIGLWQRWLFVAVFVLAAVYTYHLVEDPIRKSNWLKKPSGLHHGSSQKAGRPGKPLISLSLLLVVSTALVAIALIPPKTSSVSPVLPVADSEELTADSAVPESLPLLSGLESEISTALSATEWPDLSPSLDDMLAKNIQAPSDVTWCGLHTVDESRCTWGDPNASHTAVIVGNSVSLTYVGALRSAFADGTDWQIISYGKFACQFMDKTLVPDETFTSMPEGCATRSDEALEAINRLSPEIVFVSGLGTIANGGAITSSQLDKIDVPTKIVFLPGPPIDKDVKDCYTKLSSPVDCVSTVDAAWNPAEKQIANSRGDYFLDSRQWFCIDNSCPSFVGSVPTKLDDVHMTPEYASHIGPVIWETMEEEGLVAPSAE